MEVSLEELIKSQKVKKIAAKQPRGVDKIPPKGHPYKNSTVKQRLSVNRASNQIDARSKIISNNRNKIRDARERISARPKVDARLKLMKNNKKTERNGRAGNFTIKTNKRGQPLSLTTKRKAYFPRNDDRRMDVDEFHGATSISLRRTVHNEFAYAPMPEMPTFNRIQNRNLTPPPSAAWNSEVIHADPFDCYQVPVRRPVDMVEPLHLQREIRNYNENGPLRPGILRRSPPRSQYYQNDSLSTSMRSRLETTPNPYESEGIFSKLPVDSFPIISRQVTHQPQQQQQQQQNGFRIVVSNLHHSVTQSDIKELFEDIGVLLESRLVRPGVAEVIFKTLADAEEAVECYHNRQLDGQPMKCMLVKPRVGGSNKPPTAPAIKLSTGPSRSTSSQFSSHKAPVEIDIDALHKVLFRNK
jgi:polymerase delta-interacting protein 3